MPNIELQRIARHCVRIPIEGKTPLIVHQFGAKAQQIMLDNQMGKKTRVRPPKDPEALYQAARHRLPPDEQGRARDGFPSVGFKAAMVDAARFFKGSKLPMTDLRRMLFVNGETEIGATAPQLLTPIMGAWEGHIDKLEPAEPTMRQDPARNDRGGADIRFRPQYSPWSAVIEVIFPPASLSLETIINLLDAAGMCGVGEWRPSSKESATGSFGTFSVREDAVPEVTPA